MNRFGFSPSVRVQLQRISVEGFRNLEAQTIDLGAESNLVLGHNGQGKTNLLEAIYVLATGKSFRSVKNIDMIRFEERGFRIRGEVREQHGVVELGTDVVATPGRRRLLVGDRSVALSSYLGLLPTIAVTAERMAIVRGGPDERRRYVDRGLLLDEPRHVDLMRTVEKIHRQRVALLRSDGSRASKRDNLLSWNQALLEPASRLRRLRREYLDDISRRVLDLRERLGRPKGNLVLRYQPAPVAADDSESLERAFGAQIEQELSSGRALVGPARDDVEILVEGHPARTFSSAGEQKAIVLALKLAKILRVRERGERVPLLLVDDIDAELDEDVFGRFLSALPRGGQMVATSAKPDWVEAATEVALPRDSRRPTRFLVDRGWIRAIDNDTDLVTGVAQ